MSWIKVVAINFFVLLFIFLLIELTSGTIRVFFGKNFKLPSYIILGDDTLYLTTSACRDEN